MEAVLDLVSMVLLLAGSAFVLIGGIGVLRLPDFYTRIHGAGITDTLGAGLVLLGLPVLKLFLFDVFLLEQAYRVAAFVTLGALLLATGLAYQRYGTTIKEFFVGEPS